MDEEQKNQKADPSATETLAMPKVHSPSKAIPRDIIDSCCICIDNFVDENVIVETKCNHLFHEECLKQWVG